MRTSVLFGAKNIGFFKIYALFSRTRGKVELSQCGHFSDKGEGSVFHDFFADVVYGRLLKLN